MLSNFDIGVNFWKTNPQFKVLGPFKKFYSDDKSKGKVDSSQLMWAFAFMCERSDNRFAKYSEEDRRLLIADYLEDKKLDWKKYTKYLDFWYNSILSPGERHVSDLIKKMEERAQFIKNTPYSIENGDKLDKFVVSTDKILDSLEKAQAKLDAEGKGESPVKGGRKESASEKGDL